MSKKSMKNEKIMKEKIKKSKIMKISSKN